MGHHVWPSAHCSMGMPALDWGSVQRDCVLQCRSTGTSFLTELKYFTVVPQVQQPHSLCLKISFSLLAAPEQGCSWFAASLVSGGTDEACRGQLPVLT